MTRIAFGATLTLLVLSAPQASGRSVGEAFQDVVAKEMGVDSEVISIAAATLPKEMHYFGATELSALNLNTK